MNEKKISLSVNGRAIEVEERYFSWTLARYLREVLDMKGTKQSCDSEGTCGTCTVIVNGRPKRACLTKVSSLDQSQIETIENLQVMPDQIPHPLLQTVIQDGIFQCGYCAPGAILSAKALLDENLTPSDKEIEKALTTVICRCAGLNRMDYSVRRAAAILRGEEMSTWFAEDTANEERMLGRLTGKLRFTGDLTFPGMVYAKAVRSKIPHARVVSVDVTRAETMPGIIKVLTARDIPGKNRMGSITPDQPVFCDENNPVRYVGDAIALVVGETQEQVELAAIEVGIELEPLPIISTTEFALSPEAPVLHERLRKSHPEAPNILAHYRTEKGDVETGFSEADIIIEGDYEVPFVEHAYMEIECSIAVPELDGNITIYCGTQGPVEDQHQVAEALGVPKDKIRIAHIFMGGGFGGKEDIAGQIHAALGVLAAGRPVKVQWTRTESLLVSTKRHAIKMHYKTGATHEGKLVAAEVQIYGDTGPYASVGEAVLFRTSVFACGPYVIPHVKVDSYAIHTNNAISGAFRGYGSPQVAFAAEVQMDKIAAALGLDPMEMRLQNALGLGDATITGDVLTREVGVEIKACLNAVKAALKKMPLPEVTEDEKLGIGIAAAYKNVGFGSNLPDSAGAQVSLEPDGSFLVRHGATDMGQGANEVMAAIVARVLGVPVKLIKVHTADTKYDPPGGMTTASRQTFLTGNAALQASQQLKEKLWETISEEFSVPKESLSIINGIFVDQRNGRTLISLKDLSQGNNNFVVQVTYEAPKTQPAPKHSASYPKLGEAPLHFAYDFGAQAALVAVNFKTGVVRVIKIIAAHDVGKAILRKNVIGQIEGAVVQGVGYALGEKYPMENGRPKVTKFKDLGLLRFRELPSIEPIIIEDPHPKGPMGAKGVGELTITPTAPAIVNAVYNAIGVWINELPITREKVLEAIHEKQK
jgi:aldehyde oxidoreductase